MLLRDLRYAALGLRRSPLFTVVAVASIALGIAVSAGVFAVMNAVLFRPLGVGDPQSFYRVFAADRDGRLYGASSYHDYERYKGAGVIASACATERVQANLQVQGATRLHQGELVSPDCFDALRLPPGPGRYFSAADATSSASTPIVISHALWVGRFGQSPAAVGQTALLNGLTVAIVGVGPRHFAGTSLDGGAEFWVPSRAAPVVMPPGVLADERQRFFTVFARLEPGVTAELAQATLGTPARRVTIMREQDARFVESPSAITGMVSATAIAVTIVILIACVNLATMVTARGATRSREIAIRLAIGASRGHIIRQLAAESLLITGAGVALAGGVLWTLLRIFESYRPAAIPAFDLAIDWRVMATAALLATAVTVLAGVAPARHALRLAMAEGLGGRAAVVRMGRWVVRGREALIVLQVAVSIGLLMVAALVAGALGGGTTPPGFSTAGIAVVPIHLDAIPEDEHGAITQKLIAAVEAVPDVSSASVSALIPLTGSNLTAAVTTSDGRSTSMLANVVSAGHFATIGMPLLAGRDFSKIDLSSAPPVAVVSETLARREWGSLSPLGQPLTINDRVTTVIGVVADTRYRSLSEPFQPVVYVPVTQAPRRRFVLHAKMRGDSVSLEAVDRAARTVDARVAIDGVTAMRTKLDDALVGERATQWAGLIVGILQLCLALMALWGLVAYAVTRRTREMGIRLALGATPGSIVRLVMTPAAILIVAGTGAGGLIGAAAATMIQSESVGLGTIDLARVLPVALVFLTTALASAWWPARRAGLADPAQSLRSE